MRRWEIAYWVVLVATALALGVSIAVLASHGSPKPSSVEPNYDAVAVCVWERWDSGADMTPVVRFCYRFALSEYKEVP